MIIIIIVVVVMMMVTAVVINSRLSNSDSKSWVLMIADYY